MKFEGENEIFWRIFRIFDEILDKLFKIDFYWFFSDNFHDFVLHLEIINYSHKKKFKSYKRILPKNHFFFTLKDKINLKPINKHPSGHNHFSFKIARIIDTFDSFLCLMYAFRIKFYFIFISLLCFCVNLVSASKIEWLSGNASESEMKKFCVCFAQRKEILRFYSLTIAF